MVFFAGKVEEVCFTGIELSGEEIGFCATMAGF
jgi:hypothetical protein